MNLGGLITGQIRLEGVKLSLLTHQVYIKKLGKTSTFEEVRVTCAEISKRYGFDHFMYLAQVPTSFVKPYYLYISGYPPEWVRRYKRGKYMKKDPVVHHCARNITPIDWQEVQELSFANESVAKLMRDASKYGLRNGLSVPVHGRHGDSAIMNFSMNRDDRKTTNDINKARPDLYLLSAYIHEAAMRILDGKDLILHEKDVTSREKECLLWVAEGETTWDIANRLGITESTVIFHLQNVMKKLGAANRQQAIAKAVLIGLVSPEFK